MTTIYKPLNLAGNVLSNAAPERVNVLPTQGNFEGRKVYLATTKTLHCYLNSNWVNMITTYSLANNTDDGLMSSAQFVLLNNATPSASNETLVKRTDTGTLEASDPTSPDEVVTKRYFDQHATSGFNYVGTIEGSDNPDYPAAAQGAAFKINSDGQIGGPTGPKVGTGDTLLCKETSTGGDHPNAGNDFLIFQGNIDHATTDKEGYVRLATAAEVSGGSTTEAVVTVADVTSMMGAGAIGVLASIAANTNQLVVQHNLDCIPLVQIMDNVTKEYVDCGISFVDSNTISLNFVPATPNPMKASINRGGPSA